MYLNRRHSASARILAVGLLASAVPGFAGGPLLVCDPATGTPFSYPAGTIPVFTDPGSMGPDLTNAEADALTVAGFAEWSGVATSFFDAAVSGDIAADVTAANAGTIIGTLNGHGGFDVIYDADGTIISDFFGAPPGVLGISSPDFAAGCAIDESWTVLNGAAVEPLDVAGASFGGVFTHEIGHAINLAHSQTNGAILFFGDAIGPAACPTPYAGSPAAADMETMYPFVDPSPAGVGIEMASVDLLDDIASMSNLYPTAGWPGSAGAVSGTIFLSDGVTEATGVNVIARNVADPFGDAISALSGDLTQGVLGADGAYSFHGLTVGGSYAIYVDSIVAGGFSTTPFALALPDQEEFWNDTSEGSDPAVDDRCDQVSAVAALTPPSADVLLNALADLHEPNDDFVSAAPISCGFSDSAGIDPLGDVDFFTFTLGSELIVSIDVDAAEVGSTLDSFLGLFDAGEALLTSSDDDPAPGELVTLDSFIESVLAPGTYFIGVTSFADSGFDGGPDSSTVGTYTLELTCQVLPLPPAPGVLLGSTGTTGGALIEIDTATGAGLLRAPHGSFGPVTEIEFRFDGALFGSTGGGSSNIITIDPQFGDETLVGGHVLGRVNGLEFVGIPDGDVTTAFDEDFEGDTSGWTATGLWHQVASSACASPENGFSSPVNAFYYGQDATCDYETGAASSGTLTSPEISGIAPSSVLTFQYLRQVESFAGAFDQTEVRIVTAGGTTSVWARDTSDPSAAVWTSSDEISLAAFAGETIRIEFFFDTVDDFANAQIGWFVDDVEITEVPFVEVLYGTYVTGQGAFSELVVVDQASAELTFIGPTGFGAVGGLAYDRSTSTLYGVSDGSLITIDPATGAGTLVGFTGFSTVTALELAPDGTLFGGLGMTGDLIVIDPATGSGALVGPTGFPGVSGLAFVPCPDGDRDGVCDALDACPGFNDNADADSDGVPDDCDLCQGDDASGDGDADGICADTDCDDGDPATAFPDACGVCGGDSSSCLIFADGFESGGTLMWSVTRP